MPETMQLDSFSRFDSIHPTRGRNRDTVWWHVSSRTPVGVRLAANCYIRLLHFTYLQTDGHS